MVFLRKSSLKRHMEEEHIRDKSVVHDKSNGELNHAPSSDKYSKVHTGEKLKKSVTLNCEKNSGSREKSQEDLILYQCNYCLIQFGRKSVYQIHMRTHTIFKCIFCKKEFSSISKFNIHLKVHNEKQFKCDTCGIYFINKLCFLKHLKKHSSKKSFRSKTSTTRLNSYQCNYCKVLFFNKNELINDINNHLKIKKLQCQMCNISFTRQLTEPKNLKLCDVCNVLF